MAQVTGRALRVPAIFRRCQAWDDKWLLRINAKNETRFTKCVELFSFCGRLEAWLLVAISLILIWYNPLGALYVGLNIAFGLVLIVLCKVFINRPRPFLITPGVRVLEGPNNSASFPSWHAYNVISGVLALYIIIGSWQVLGLGIIFAICVGLTRPFLGVHYLTDVLGGWIIGIFGFWVSFLLAPFLLPLFHAVEQSTLIPLVSGTWNPLLSMWWYLLAIAGLYVCILSIFIYTRKKRKSKVMWR